MTDPIQQIQQLINAGQLDAAEALCRAVLAAQSNQPLAWSLLGWLCLRQSRFAEAESALVQATSLNPNSAHAWGNLSLAVRQQHRAAEAESFARKAAELEPQNANHWINLGGTLADQGRWEEARAAYDRAVACDPQNSTAWKCLGQSLQALGQIAAAFIAFERSLNLAPVNWELTAQLGDWYIQTGKPHLAAQRFKQFVNSSPGSYLGWLAYGHTCYTLQEVIEAEAAFRQALAINPGDVQALHLLATSLFSRWELTEAEAAARQIVDRHPEEAASWVLLGLVQQALGNFERALKSLRYGIMQGAHPENHSRLLVALQYAEDAEPGKLLEHHRQWDELYARSLTPRTPPSMRPRSSPRPLRIGFVSADFHRHPIAFLALPLLEQIDQARATVICYADSFSHDEYSSRFQAAADLWRTTFTLTDAEIAGQIRQDEVDILIDLMGHVGSRLLVFAHQPAPIQMTWLGYVGTTGLQSMDYLLADSFHVRAGEEAYYSEQILRLPHGYACYAPPVYAPPVQALPALASGHVTFGCFNNTIKFTPRMLNAWATILDRVPHSQLLLKYGSLSDSTLPGTVLKHFTERGIDRERIVLEAGALHPALLETYHRIDLALDTQPYSGGLTTCEALWMGVPVITFPGQTFAGRHSTSHLSNAGFPQFSAPDLNGYVELAVEWANRLDELAAIRLNMREKVCRSPLCNATQFASDFLNVLERV